jgi:hypothetical protein
MSSSSSSSSMRPSFSASELTLRLFFANALSGFFSPCKTVVLGST